MGTGEVMLKSKGLPYTPPAVHHLLAAVCPSNELHNGDDRRTSRGVLLFVPIVAEQTTCSSTSPGMYALPEMMNTALLHRKHTALGSLSSALVCHGKKMITPHDDCVVDMRLQA